MAKYSKKQGVSEKTAVDALKVSRANQRPGQTKEQTKLISQGIQKGIEQYKKQHKEKSRELDKKLRKVSEKKSKGDEPVNEVAKPANSGHALLAWVLLLLSWIGFAIYIYISL